MTPAAWAAWTNIQRRIPEVAGYRWQDRRWEDGRWQYGTLSDYAVVSATNTIREWWQDYCAATMREMNG